MRQIFLALSFLLLGISWAAAQGSMNQSGSSSGTQSSSGEQMSVEGCLSGSSGNYTLTDQNGMAYRLTGDSAKLSEHVGHEIKVTGMSESGSMSGNESGSASTGANSGSEKTLQVSSVKHISKTCKQGGGMAH